MPPAVEIQLQVEQVAGSGGTLLHIHFMIGPCRYSVAYPTHAVPGLCELLQQAVRDASQSRIILPGGAAAPPNRAPIA